MNSTIPRAGLAMGINDTIREVHQPVRGSGTHMAAIHLSYIQQYINQTTHSNVRQHRHLNIDSKTLESHYSEPQIYRGSAV